MAIKMKADQILLSAMVLKFQPKIALVKARTAYVHGMLYTGGVEFGKIAETAPIRQVLLFLHSQL
jgi:hypothetical protein